MHPTQTARTKKIEVIMNSIKKAEDEGYEVDYDKLLYVVMVEQGATKRTAEEYIDEAKWRLKRLRDIEAQKAKDEPISQL